MPKLKKILAQKKKDILHERREREREKKDDTLRLANLQAKITVIEANDDDGASSNSNKGSDTPEVSIVHEDQFDQPRRCLLVREEEEEIQVLNTVRVNNYENLNWSLDSASYVDATTKSGKGIFQLPFLSSVTYRYL